MSYYKNNKCISLRLGTGDDDYEFVECVSDSFMS